MAAQSRWLSKFSRVTTSRRQFIPEVDGLRFFAIMTVLLYHLNTNLLRVTPTLAAQAEGSGWNTLISRGGMGVQVFFAISGFILALPFARYHFGEGKKVALKSYLLRRLTRLEPPYIIALTALLLLQVVLLDADFVEALPHYFASLGYLHNIIYDAWSTINPVAWSLEVEVQFYLLAPVLSLVFAIRPAALRRFVLVAALCLSAWWKAHFFELWQDLHLSKSLVVELHHFLLGFLIADFYLSGWRTTSARWPWLWDALAGLGLVALWYGKGHYGWPSTLLFISGSGLLFLGAFRGQWVRWFFQNPWVSTIGGMCYSIYLLHYALLAFLMNYTTRLHTSLSYGGAYAVQALLLIPVVLIVSGLFFRVAERPFMHRHWPQQFAQWVRRQTQRPS